MPRPRLLRRPWFCAHKCAPPAPTFASVTTPLIAIRGVVSDHLQDQQPKSTSFLRRTPSYRGKSGRRALRLPAPPAPASMSATAPPIAASGASPSTAMCSLDGEMPEKRNGRAAAVRESEPRAAPSALTLCPLGSSGGLMPFTPPADQAPSHLRCYCHGVSRRRALIGPSLTIKHAEHRCCMVIPTLDQAESRIAPCEKNWSMETKTMVTPIRKLSVSVAYGISTLLHYT